MQRRNFIKNTSLGALAISTTSPLDLLATKKKPYILSLQLYSVRDAMTKDPVGTIKALANIGYKDCEHAGYNNEKDNSMDIPPWIGKTYSVITA